jgi:hypothetical protein
VPLLQVWLYASRAEGRFEKRYPELCEILDIVCHKHLSLIRRQLEPSLTELTDHGYLAAWSIEPTADGREFKLVASHGEKFYRDQKIRASLPPGQTAAGPVPLLKLLTERGVNEVQAQRLLRSLSPEQPVADQLEYGDYLVWKSRSTIKNAPGFYVYLLRQNILPPDDFETSSRRAAREAVAERKAEASRSRIALEDGYNEFCREKVHAYLDALDEHSRRDLLAVKMRAVRAQWGHLPAATIEELANRQLERELREQLHLPSLEQFARRNPQESLFD